MSTYTRAKFRVEVRSAAQNGDIRTLKKLAEAKIKDASGFANTATHWDFQEADDLMGQTPLHTAAESGQLEVLKFLVEQEVEVDCKDGEGWTPLHWACCIRQSDRAEPVVRELLVAKASLEVTNAQKDYPLHFAASNGHLEVVKLLVDSGAKVNVQNEEKQTPSHCAAQRGHTDIIKFLAKKGADVSRRNSLGNSPLHLASKSNHISAVSELMAAAPDAASEKNSEGKTPAELAACEAAKDACMPLARAMLVAKAAVRFSRLKASCNSPRRPKADDVVKRPKSPSTPLGFRLSNASKVDPSDLF